jgi:hypothetical protein
MNTISLSDIAARVKALADRALNGEAVQDGEWTALAAAELKARALDEATRERQRAEREAQLRRQFVELQQQLATQQQVVSECSAAAMAIEDAAQARESQRMSRDASLHSPDVSYAEKMAALKADAARAEDFELSQIKAENEERISRYHVGIKLGAALSRRDELQRQLVELKRAAADEGVTL